MGGRAGRLERFVKRMVEPVEEPYRCLGCGGAFDVEYHVCPDCGGYRVERVVDA